MTSLPDAFSPADDWPPWTDEDRWGLGPEPEDALWWSQQNESRDADEPVPDELHDRRADEAEAQDLHERGLLPL